MTLHRIQTNLANQEEADFRSLPQEVLAVDSAGAVEGAGVTTAELADSVANGHAGFRPITQITEVESPFTPSEAVDFKVESDATGGNITVALAALSTYTDGHTIEVHKLDGGANTVTIDPDGAETINGAATLVLTAQYHRVSFYKSPTAGEWVINWVTN